MEMNYPDALEANGVETRKEFGFPNFFVVFVQTNATGSEIFGVTKRRHLTRSLSKTIISLTSHLAYLDFWPYRLLKPKGVAIILLLRQ
jgi:hypothetical protein